MEAGTQHDMVALVQPHRKRNFPLQAPGSDFPKAVTRSGSNSAISSVMDDISTILSVSV